MANRTIAATVPRSGARVRLVQLRQPRRVAAPISESPYRASSELHPLLRRNHRPPPSRRNHFGGWVIFELPKGSVSTADDTAKSVSQALIPDRSRGNLDGRGHGHTGGSAGPPPHQPLKPPMGPNRQRPRPVRAASPDRVGPMTIAAQQRRYCAFRIQNWYMATKVTGLSLSNASHSVRSVIVLSSGKHRL